VATLPTPPRHSPSLRYGEPQKQNLPFPFSKKIRGAKKRIKTQRQNFDFCGFATSVKEQKAFGFSRISCYCSNILNNPSRDTYNYSNILQ
jgi:hypothetical protein